MITKLVRLAILLAALAAFPTVASASPLRYTFEFNQLSFNGVTYPADSFSFVVPSLLNFGQTATVNSPEDLNGFPIVAVSVCGSSNFVDLTYCGTIDFSVPIGSVGSFSFLAPGAQNGPGVYFTTDALRGIKTAPGQINFVAAPGALTIQDVAVPEPGTLVLLSLGLGTTLVRRKRL